VELNCQDVIQGISEYLDHEMSADLRRQMEQHFKGCEHCTAILDGTRNVIALVGDGRTFLLPAGFSERLLVRLNSLPKN
jgi:anti-sigma factor (TIGR02949 family)